ncbi:MAG TPA: MGMT family protein, partial [Plasticicumulans sp.]|nr:MGMT family protein [Plasticicumulans sp.]
LIPCHRVIRAAGELGGYHWGLTRKRALIGYEAARGAVEAVPPSVGAEAADLFPAGASD